MLWVVQNNLYNEAGYKRFIEALERLGTNYMIVKPVPFTNKLLPHDFDSMVDDFESTPEPEIDDSQDIVICGATSLSRISKAKGWTPGTFLNDNFDFSVWREGYGKDYVLNGDSVVGTAATVQVPAEWDWVFLRPVLDSKAFTGMVLSKHDFHDWRMMVSNLEEEEFAPLHKNTVIAVGPQKKIYAEYRLFIVDGKYVTGSLYKLGTEVIYKEMRDDTHRDVILFAYGQLQTWQPADAYVMDIAETPDGYKVIEINNINSAGFYDSDVQKIVMAIEDMVRFGATDSEGILC